MPSVKYITSTQNPMEILKQAAGECYQKEATDKVIDHIVKAGHLSVLEHCTATFRIKCSTLVLLQFERHRFMSMTVQSSRGTVIDTWHEPGDGEFNLLIKEAMERYKAAEKKYGKEKAAYLMPKAAEYNLTATANFRTWFEWLPKRLCLRASKEHRELARLLETELMEICPEVFRYAKPKCNACREKGCRF